MGRIEVAVDDEANRAFPERWLASVRLWARGREFGLALQECVPDLGWEAAVAKFEALAGPHLPGATLAAVEHAVGRPEDEAGISAIARSLRLATGPGLPVAVAVR